MKTKYKRFGKSTLSVILALLMLISSLMLGSIATIEASADSITSDGTMIIYYKKNPSSANWWETNSPTTVLRLQNGSSTDYGWADPVSLDSTKGYYVIPSGTWTKGKMFRKGPGQTLHESNTFWNQTKTFDLDSTKNYIENYGKAENNVEIVWNRYTPQLTYSLTPSSTTIDNGGSVTFTLTNTSNNTSLVTDPISEYIVTDGDRTCTLGTDYTVSGNTITFLKNDNVYTVTKTIEYYAKGFNNNSNLKGTATVNSCTVTVGTPSNDEHDISTTQSGGTGTVALSAQSAKRNTEVTVTITPPTSPKMVVGEVTVTKDASGDTVAATRTSATAYKFTMPNEDVTVNVTYSDKYVVWFDNTSSSSSWSTVYAYAFSGTGQNEVKHLGAWPGTAMKKMSDISDNYYGIEIPVTASTIIFNNGSGGSENQTNDITPIINDAIYIKDGNTTGYGANNGLKVDKTVNYYYAGRMKGYNDGAWFESPVEEFKMTLNSTTNCYEFNTGYTLKELADFTHMSGSGNTFPLQFFVLKTGSLPYTTYKRSSEDGAIGDSSSKTTLSTSAENNLTYSGSLNVGTVKIVFNPANYQIWYEVTGADTHTVNAEGNNASAIALSKTSAYEGETVTATITVPNGMFISEVTATYTDANSQTQSIAVRAVEDESNQYSFTMPDADVNVGVTFRDPFTFTVTPVVDTTIKTGSINPTAGTAINVTEGGSTTITATPGANAAVEWEFSNQNYTATTSNNGNTLTIAPQADIVVTAKFVEKTYTYTGNAKVFVYKGSKPESAEAIANNATPVDLIYNDAGELFAKFTVEENEDYANKILSYNGNYCFTCSNDGNPLHITCTSSSSNDLGWKEKDNLSVDKPPASQIDYLDEVKFEGQNIGEDSYQFFLVNFSESATEFYIYVGTYNTSNQTVSFYNGTTDRWLIKGSAETVETVPIYAKTGTIRNVSTSDNQSEIGDYDKYSFYTDITLEYVANDGTLTTVKTTDSKDYDVNGIKHYRLRKAKALTNSTIKVTATIRDQVNIDKYYIRGFNVNGVAMGEVKQGNDTGVYSFILDTSKFDQSQPIEITPVYFYRNDDECVTFKVEDFAEGVRDKWGNTIACYAWYVGGTNVRNNNLQQFALGGYPGQPLLGSGNSYYVQVPKKDDVGNSIKGITLNNYVWDEVHGGGELRKYHDFNGMYTDTNYERRDCNAQTYDYDDFLPLMALDDVDIIVFNINYETFNTGNAADGGNFNYANDSNPAGTRNLKQTDRFGQNWAALVDYNDIPVDLFGNRIDVKTNDEKSDEAITSHKNAFLYSGHVYYNDSYILNNYADADKYYIAVDGYVNYYKTAENNALASSGTDSSGTDYLGEYATKWAVYKYDPDNVQSDKPYTLVGSLPPSAFITKAGFIDSLDAATYINVVDGVKKLKTGTKPPNAFLDYTIGLNAKKPDDYATGTVARQAMWDQYVALYNECYNKPCVITYESSLKSEGRLGATPNPGDRCDGRWYYSRSTEKEPIMADIKIWIKDNTATTNYTFKSGDNYYLEDAYKTEEIDGETVATNVGSVTNATAKFTNETPYDCLTNKTFNGKTLAYVYKNVNAYFTYDAVTTSTGTNYTISGTGTGDSVKAASTSGTTATYDFVGWYSYTGGALTPVNKESFVDMGANVTLIAVYEKYDPGTLPENQKKTLVVNHDLYYKHADYNLAETAGKEPAITNGKNGNTAVTVTITSNGISKKFTSDSGYVRISPEYLTDRNATVDIVLTTTPGEDHSVVDTYFHNETVAENTAHYTNTDLTKASDYSTTGRVVYKQLKLSDLFDMDNLATEETKTLNYFTNLFRSYITVTVKYYDRDTSAAAYGKPVDMSDEVKEVSLKLTGFSSTDTLAQFDSKFLAQFNMTDNEMDTYKYWLTQKMATTGGTDSNGNPVKSLANLPYYNGDTVSTYGAMFSGKSADFAYHTNKYAYPQISTTTLDENEQSVTIDHYVETVVKNSTTGEIKTDKREKWASYRDASNVELISNDQLDTSSGITEVSNVVIWLYNSPKTYHFHAYYIPDGDTQKTPTFETFTKGENTMYVETGNMVGKDGFYNQRIGVANQTQGTGTEDVTPYLEGYGVSSPYFGHQPFEVKAKENISYVQGETTTSLVFDGWYRNVGTDEAPVYSLLSTDRSYQNRITNDLEIYAVYRPTSVSATPVSVSVSDVVVDTYIDAQENVQVRYNTQLNVAGTEVSDNDTNIKYVAALYFDLPAEGTDPNGKTVSLDWTKTANINALKTYLNSTHTVTEDGKEVQKTGSQIIGSYVQNHINLLSGLDPFKSDSQITSKYRTNSKNYSVVLSIGEVEVDAKGKVSCFTYKVATTPNAALHEVTLTSKNRIQFTLSMTYEDYQSKPFLSYVAIKRGDNWYLSENYVSNIDVVEKYAQTKNASGSYEGRLRSKGDVASGSADIVEDEEDDGTIMTVELDSNEVDECIYNSDEVTDIYAE